MKLKIPNPKSGQTLIETIGAIFVLTMALSAVLGVIIYALAQGEVSQKQVVATNLAREGVDVVRMMRDTNWLESDAENGSWALDSDCGAAPPPGNTGSPPTGQNSGDENFMDGKVCYPRWMTGPSNGNFHGYDIDPQTVDEDSRLAYVPPTTWILESLSGQKNYNLCLMPDGSYQHSNPCDNNANPPFARKVSIIRGSNDIPYTRRNPQLRVTSTVIWSGRSCPAIDNEDPATFSTNCKVITEEIITNWKDYR